MHLYTLKFGISRLVWQHENPPPPRKPRSSWGGADEVRQQWDTYEVNRTPDYVPPAPEPPKKPDEDEKPSENPEDEKPIDPGNFVPLEKTFWGREQDDTRPIAQKFDKLDKKIIEELDRIEEEEFNSKIHGLESTETGVYLVDIVKDMKEAILYRACTLHWKRKTLYEEYRKQIRDLYIRSYGHWTSRAYNWTGKTLRSLVSQTDRVPRLPGHNPALNSRRIKPEKRQELITKLRTEEKRIEDDLITNKRGFSNRWYAPWRWRQDYNENLHDFLKEQYFPFYRQYFADIGIMENEEGQERIISDYKDFLEDHFEKVLK